MHSELSTTRYRKRVNDQFLVETAETVPQLSVQIAKERILRVGFAQPEMRRAMSDLSRVGNTGRRSVWDNRTTVRRLHGIEYRMLEDSDDIHDFINIEVRKELEADLESIGEDPKCDVLLNSLPKRRWKLEIISVDEVRMNPSILNSADIKTGRKFMERLKERRLELRKALEMGGAIIWPIVLLREERLLVDGYCRHSTLQEMNIPEAYGYVGRLFDK